QSAAGTAANEGPSPFPGRFANVLGDVVVMGALSPKNLFDDGGGADDEQKHLVDGNQWNDRADLEIAFEIAAVERHRRDLNPFEHLIGEINGSREHAQLLGPLEQQQPNHPGPND